MTIVVPPKKIYYIPEQYKKWKTKVSHSSMKPKMFISDPKEPLPIDTRVVPLTKIYPNLPSDRMKYIAPDGRFPEQFKVLRRKFFKVAIFGHSLVYHLRPFMPKIPKTYCEVEFFGISGGRLQTNNKFTLDEEYIYSRWVRYKPHLTIFMFGGNDIEHQTQVEDLFEHFKKLTEKIVWEGTFLFHLVEKRYWLRDGQKPQYFNFKVGLLNNLIEQEYPDQYISSAFIDSESARTDGVHLTEESNDQLARNIIQRIGLVANPLDKGPMDNQYLPKS
jgi:hypothetical protein